jgi:hypothetical protein
MSDEKKADRQVEYKIRAKNSRTEVMVSWPSTVQSLAV